MLSIRNREHVNIKVDTNVNTEWVVTVCLMLECNCHGLKIAFLQQVFQCLVLTGVMETTTNELLLRWTTYNGCKKKKKCSNLNFVVLSPHSCFLIFLHLNGIIALR